MLIGSLTTGFALARVCTCIHVFDLLHVYHVEKEPGGHLAPQK